MTTICMRLTNKGRISFLPNVLLTCTITAKLGEAKIVLRDEIENQVFEKVPHMILYHVNLGYPLMCENSQFKLPPLATIPKDPVAAGKS